MPAKRDKRIFRTLRDYLDATGTSQKELAKVLGISEPHICNILRGRANASAILALRISRTCRVPIETLIESERVS